MARAIKSPLGLIDPNHLRSDERYVTEVRYEMFENKQNRLFIKGNYLVHNRAFWNRLDNVWESDQDEFPLLALPWVIDRLENGFLKRPSEGGLTDFERSVSGEFDGELIGINAMMHCCAENLPGYNIWNASRASYITNDPPQEWDIPRYMLLERGLLEELKKIAADYAP